MANKSINTPLYIKIFNDYKSQIEDGTLNSGDKLPSEKEICEIYDVSRITSKKAMEKLRDEKYVVRRPGKGTFVNESTVEQASVLADKHPLENGTAKSSKKLIGLIMPDFSESYGMEIVTGIEEACQDLGYNLLLRRSFRETKNEREAITDLHDAGCAGLILIPQHNDYFNDLILRLIIDDFPVVILDREMSGIDTNSVVSDNYQSAYDMTIEMIKQGHKDIAFVSYPIDSATTLKDRMQGFRDALYDNKLYWNNKFLLDDFNIDAVETDFNLRAADHSTAIKDFILKNPEVSAFFATEYNFAQIVIEDLTNLGYNVPGDYSVVGYDGPSSVTGNPFLTRVLQPQEEMGRKTVEMLHANINGKEHVKKLKLPAVIRHGKSLARARINSVLV